MGVPENLNTNEDKVAYSSLDEIDRVIFAKTYKLDVTNSVGTYNFDQDIDLDLSFGRPIGIYSLDNGATWNDIGGLPSTGSLVRGVTLPAVQIVPYQMAAQNKLRLEVKVNSTVGGGTTFPVLVSICLLATDNPGVLSKAPQLGNQKTAMASMTPEKLSSKYRKIRFRTTLNTPVGTGVNTVPHGLGYVPDLFVWVNDNFNTPVSANYIAGFMLDARFISTGNRCVVMDATNIYIFNNNIQTDHLVRGYKP